MKSSTVLLLAAVAFVKVAYISGTGGRMDLNFVLDASGSDGEDGWTQVKDFAASVVGDLPVSPSLTRVGVVRYSDFAYPYVYFSNTTTKADMQTRIRSGEYIGTTTNHTGALRVAREQIFHSDKGCRTNAPNILVIVTDGTQNMNDTNTIVAGTSLTKEKCIRIITVQIWGGYKSGNGPSVSEANYMTDRTYQINATSFDTLSQQKDAVVAKINALDNANLICAASLMCRASQLDPCSSAPCQNGATCTKLTATTYQCTCAPGYSGNNCQTDVNDCAPTNPCLNGGNCQDGVNSYTCQCPSGFSGTRCEQNDDNCNPNPCKNQGICADGPNLFVCSCATGFSGNTCDLTTGNACSNNPCLNGGTCSVSGTSYTCRCASGWTGNNCQTADGNAGNACVNSPCKNGGSCFNQVSTFTCRCTSTWTGPTCESKTGVQQTDKVQMTILAILLVLTGVFLVLSLILICCVFCGACTRRRYYYEEQRDGNCKESVYSDYHSYNGATTVNVS